ncbi:hypothetical protein PYJP_12440 [Pyrofollis japonicus]|uniref:hypothetical protein n=1 Tax=Pyrofollis japonicus TaxID=3060460 RepID=UPI00295C2F21|nr:hypothetical protein [Pyrofollis japonicus]BEP17892.1 hypothetical protein PYJP_12440 [Pyrofollis japonicus]
MSPSGRISKGITEKTLEINICSNLIENIRNKPLYSKAYCRGISMRLERHLGLDVEVESGTASLAFVLGIQFKKAYNKRYDFNINKNYYIFKINNNSANDQHIILWLNSYILHNIFKNKFIFYGYAFPKFIDNWELHRSSPFFLGRTVFIDALAFPINILDRLDHEVLVYDGIKKIIVKSDEYEINEDYFIDGKEILYKLKNLNKENIIKIYDINIKINRKILEELLNELRNKIKPDVYEYINRKINRGWSITSRSLITLI